MRGVDVAFERLQPLALALPAITVGLAGRQQGRFERRQRRRYRALAHIDVNHAAALRHLVGFGLDLGQGFLVDGQVRHLQAVARRVELPAVIDAAQAALLIAAKEQGGTAMRAAVIKDADPARTVAKRDQDQSPPNAWIPYAATITAARKQITATRNTQM